MEYILLITTVFMAAVKSVLNRQVKSGTETVLQTLRFNLLTFVFAFVTVFSLGFQDLGSIFNTPWLVAFGLAVCTLGAQISLMKAVQLGPVSVSALFSYCGFIIPTVWGCIRYQEEFHFLQAVGIAMILCSFALSTKREKDAKYNVKWLLSSLGGLIFSGAIGVFQKIFTRDYAGYSLNNFLTVAFALVLVVGGVCLLIAYFIEKTRNNPISEKSESSDADVSKPNGRKVCIFAVILGVLIGLINIINTYLSGVLPSVVVFPSINGGAIITTTLLSAFVFKETPTKNQAIGLAMGVLAILLITFA